MTLTLQKRNSDEPVRLFGAARGSRGWDDLGTRLWSRDLAVYRGQGNMPATLSPKQGTRVEEQPVSPQVTLTGWPLHSLATVPNVMSQSDFPTSTMEPECRT